MKRIKAMTNPLRHKQLERSFQVSIPKHDIAERVKREYVNFINETYMPTHYLVVRLPKHWETADLDYAKGRLRLIMKVFEKSLIKNHWDKHHLPFIVTAEKGVGIYWHFNVLFNQLSFTDEMLDNARRKTLKTIKGMSDYCLNLQAIKEDDIKTFVNAVNDTDFYCLKELKIDSHNGSYNSNVIFDSVDLFYLNIK